MNRSHITGALCAALGIMFGALVVHAVADAATLTDKELLGKFLFFDTNLSSPDGQACASCHDPDTGFADPDQSLPVSEGVMALRVGLRNAPTVTYLATAPDFTSNATKTAFVGGQFWDSRAANLFEQAKAPFVNTLEMHNPNRHLVVHDISKAAYAPLFKKVYGKNAFRDIDYAYESMADAIAAFEKSPELNKFNSKFDYFLAGEEELTAQETLGLQLFTGKANCSGCHAVTLEPGSGPQVFSAFRFANIGVPRNENNPFYLLIPSLNPDGAEFQDLGLGGFLKSIGEPPEAYEPQLGKMNFPTVRNIAKTAPYFHNGVFADLKTVVHFFNTRDVPAEGWPPPEVPVNVSQAVGNLGLTDDEEDAIVAFLNTLTDDYKP